MSGRDAAPTQREERRAIGENRVAINVGAGRDVKRHAGAKCDKRAQDQTQRRLNGAAHDKPMADVEQGAAVFAGQIIRICRKRSGAVRIAFSSTEGIIGKERNTLAEIGPHVEDQLILIKTPG